MTRLTVDAAKFRGIALFRARNANKVDSSIQPQLAGVHCLRAPNHKGVIMVATNDVIMGVGYDPTGTCRRPITVAPVKRALLESRPGRKVIVGDDKSMIVTRPGGDFRDPSDTIIPGAYPDWRGVIPDSVSIVATRSAYNGEYLAVFTKALKIFDNPRNCGIQLFPSKRDGPIVVLGEINNFVGIIMPMRMPNRDCRYPFWFPHVNTSVKPATKKVATKKAAKRPNGQPKR